jgi:hypothetical protein
MVMAMRKTDKTAIVESKTSLKLSPANLKILPFDDGSKKEK